jgi:hypothetical protein
MENGYARAGGMQVGDTIVASDSTEVVATRIDRTVAVAAMASVKP